MKLLTLFILLSTLCNGIIAQVKIGDNHDTIHPSAILELESSDKGILFPRISLSGNDNSAPLSEHKAGMIVYNIATAGSGSNAVSPGLYINNGIQWQRLVAANNTIPGAPIGSVITMAGDTVPTGYLYCNGQAISRTTYTDLFAIIGTTYGNGDGSTTFNLPDYRGYFLRGQDDGRGMDPDAGSRAGGDILGSTQEDAFKSHTHSQNYGNSGSVYAFASPSSTQEGNNQWTTDIDGTFTGPINNTGGNETRPINYAVKYCIKYTETEYTGAQGATGPAGANGNDGADGNTLLNGTSDPSSEGNEGDFYINTTTNYIFGPKTSGTWGSGTSLTGSNEVVVGSIITKVSAATPTGYLYCNGQAVSRTTYAALFADIGTTFGSGDGSTTFNLPDFRGEFLRGQNDGRGADPDAGSRTGGDAVGSSQTDAFQGHWHRERIQITNNAGGTGHNHGSTNPNETTFTDQNIIDPVSDGINGTPRTSSETRPRNIAVRYYIKY